MFVCLQLTTSSKRIEYKEHRETTRDNTGQLFDRRERQREKQWHCNIVWHNWIYNIKRIQHQNGLSTLIITVKEPVYFSNLNQIFKRVFWLQEENKPLTVKLLYYSFFQLWFPIIDFCALIKYEITALHWRIFRIHINTLVCFKWSVTNFYKLHQVMGKGVRITSSRAWSSHGYFMLHKLWYKNWVNVIITSYTWIHTTGQQTLGHCTLGERTVAQVSNELPFQSIVFSCYKII